MNITNISFFKVNPHKQKGICAYAQVEVDDLIVFRNIKVIKGKDEFFISFPNDGCYNIKDGVKKYTDLVYIKDKQERQNFQESIIKMYLDNIKQFSTEAPVECE